MLASIKLIERIFYALGTELLVNIVPVAEEVFM